MKLYITPNSPYARIARVAVHESGLRDQVECILVTTRDADTTYFDITPLARVPALVDGAVLIAQTRDICAHIDQITGTLRWCPPETAQTRTQRHVAAGFLDGIAVWLRENARSPDERSEKVMRYEEHRARKALQWLDQNAHHPERSDYTALCMACAIDIALLREMASGWQDVAPDLMNWAEVFANRPSMVATTPGLAC